MKVDLDAPAWIACAMFLSGCTLFSSTDIDVNKYLLDKTPPDLLSERTHAATLLVMVPETVPAYATTQMAYSTRAHQIAYFSRNEWAETPSQMILPLIVKTLRDTHHFSEVLSPPHSGPHTFALRVEILELKQDFTSEPAMLQFAMRIHLSREATNEVVGIKELSVREPMPERNPYAGVVAANEAMPGVLRELAKFVIDEAD